MLLPHYCHHIMIFGRNFFFSWSPAEYRFFYIVASFLAVLGNGKKMTFGLNYWEFWRNSTCFKINHIFENMVGRRHIDSSWWSSQSHKYFRGASCLGKWEGNHFWAELLRILKKFNLFHKQSYFRKYDRSTSYWAIMVALTVSQVLIEARRLTKWEENQFGGDNDIILRNHFWSSNNTFWALYSSKNAFFEKSVNQWYHAQKSFFGIQ